MTSYRLGERVPAAAQRAAGDLIIGPRLLLAAYAHGVVPQQAEAALRALTTTAAVA